MHRTTSGLARLFALALLCSSLWPSAASAQRALSQVLDLNRQAMEAYNNLEIEQAQSLLQQALDAAQRGHVTGAPLARTYVNLGIVAIGGLGDNGGGLNYFVQALQADPNVSLDPLLSTPDIQLIWTQAQSRSGGGGVVTPPPPPPPPDGGGGAVGDLVHQPVPEQLRQTPVPVYLEVPGRPAHVYIYYRGHGMRDFQRAEMESVSRGFGFEIPCEDVFEPEVAYYIVAFDGSGSPIGFAGSQTSPVTVPIVQTRTTSAPALPGRAPPEQCRAMEEECPPGMPCAHSGGGGGTAGLGESCRTDSDCASGNCDDDLCGMSTGDHHGDEHDGDEPSEDSGAPRFFARVSGGLGASYVQSGMPTDRQPCDEEDTSGTADDCTAIDSPQPFPHSQYPELGATPRNFGYDDSGFNPPSDGSDPTCSNMEAYCFYVESPGFVANFALRLDIGYYIVPRWFALALMVRFQPLSGVGPLSFMQLGLRVETELTEPAPTGFHVHLHLGFIAYGQIQVFLNRSGDRNTFAPWGASGAQGIDFGSTIGYRFLPNFGIHLQPTLVFNLPSFLFTLDVAAGFEVGF